ncbi:MAG TPA: polysaccharide biosynthesis/export family protein [Candidatus Saccharimonadales bacterium]|nr:polysaccharide biosynthesis/export family protein [Candidatus Saccharimonadales bacterium]
MNEQEIVSESTPVDIRETEVHARPRHATENGHTANGGWDSGGATLNGKPQHSAPIFDFLSLGEAILKKWYVILLSALLIGGLGAYYGITMWKPSYTATAQLLRFENPGNTELYKPRPLNERAFVDMVQAPDLLERVAAKSKDPTRSREFLRSLVVAPSHDSEKVAVSISAPTPAPAVELVNLYSAEAVNYTRQIQSREATEAIASWKEQLAQMEFQIQSITSNLQAHAKNFVVPQKRNSALADRLQTEREKLLELQLKYTDIYPSVVEQKGKVAALEKQIKETEGVGGPAKQAFLPDSDSDAEMMRSHLQAVANSKVTLIARQREAEGYIPNPPGYARVFSAATSKDVAEAKRSTKVIFLGVFGGAVGGGISLLLLVILELLDPKLKTPADAKRVTGLPVVASLGNLSKMSPAVQAQWAFRTWMSLQGKLRGSKSRGFVCGVTSSGKGEGRSTWVNLLSQAASDCGYRVLTIEASRGEPPLQPNGNHFQTDMLPEGERLAITNSMLNTPAQVTEQLTGENPQPMVHIPLPGWVWNLERRKQWQTALSQWKKIDNVVIFVELPPASEPEAVLLAEKLPNLLWLTDSGNANAAETREQLETLRDAHCNLVGTLLNHDSTRPLKKSFAKWMPCLVLCCLAFSTATQAQDAVPNQAAPPSVVTPAVPRFAAVTQQRRADWQKKLTLGPGDMLNFNFFSQPELARTEVMIGPDGRVSYLQAQDLQAAGLTIDELREKFDQELSKYYRSPRVIITPFAYNSKKYYVLGKVMNKGVFTLDKPTSIVEAVARAKGFETGTIDNQNSVDLVDLQKSFVMRQGKRLDINLERLFQDGDLSQNVALEPNDYLYFASGNLKEIYVLGEVNIPGPVTWTDSSTVISAIAARSGFNSRAYKSKVLVVRGSLNKPQTFVVDVWATLDARATDFKLQPKDIVFVGHRPFIRAEELLDLAATAFIQSSVAAWTGQNIGPLITKPIIPSL